MRHEQADVIVVGGGPAGIAAVCRLVPAGKRVIWIDQAAKPGGQIWRAGLPKPWDQALAALEGANGLQRLPGHTVIAGEGSGAGTIRLLLNDTLNPEAEARRVEAPQLLLALGSRERFLPFPGWTLPGVHGAGGLQALIKNGWPVARKRLVFAGSGPLLLAAADTARAAGAQVILVAEQAPRTALARFALGLSAAKLAQAAGLAWRLRGVPYRSGGWVTQALGTAQLEAVRLNDGSQVECDELGVGYGLLSNTDLAAALGCSIGGHGSIEVDALQRTSIAGIYAAGECTGIGGVDKALLEGDRAALAVIGHNSENLQSRHDKAIGFAARLQASFALRPEMLQLADVKTLVCRCEDVTLGAIKAQRSWRDAKLQTRCGMGACQGRICKPIVRELLGWEDKGTPREPLQPAPLRHFIQIRPNEP